MTAETITCPKCGHDNQGDAQDCAQCGITFEIYAEVKDAAKREQKKKAKKAEAPKPPQDMAICPKCRHANNPLSLDCLKCGIVFSKYFESMEMELEGDPSQEADLQTLRAARDKMDALRKQKEAEAHEEALKKQQEEQARIETLKKERQEELRRQEELKRQQQEQERLRQEELTRQQQEQEQQRQEELKRQKQEAERRHQEEIERQKAEEELKRQEDLQRQQKEAEQRRLEEIERQKAEEALKRQEELTRQQQEAEQRRLEEIERQKAEEELKRQEAIEKQQAAEQAEQEALRLEQEIQGKTEAQRRERLAELMKPKGSLKRLLKNYADQVVGLNYDAPTAYKPVRLVGINDDHFSILIEADELVYTYPMGSILALIEGVDGVRTAIGREKAVYPLVIRVSHRVM